MQDYTRIEQCTVKFSEASAALLQDCEGKSFNNDDVLHTIKVGESYVNTHAVFGDGRNDTDYSYTFRDICIQLQPLTIYQLALCLSLFNSQYKSEEPLLKVLNGKKNDSAPIEYADLLQETYGWIFWEHQFTNILRLFSLDRDEPHELLKQYKRHGWFDSPLHSHWNIHGVSLLYSMEQNMLDEKTIYRLLLKPAWVIYNEI